MADEVLLLSVAQAAQQLGIGQTKLKQYIRERKIRTARLGKRRLLHRDDVAQFAAGARER